MIRFIQGHFINFFFPKVLSLCFIWKLEQGGDKRRGKSPTPSSLTLYRSLTGHEPLLHLSAHLNFMQPGEPVQKRISSLKLQAHQTFGLHKPLLQCAHDPLSTYSISQAPLPPRALAASAGTLPAAWLALLLCSSSCVICSGGKHSPLCS